MLQLDDQILLALQQGLPLCATPYQVIADRLGISQSLLLERLHVLRQQGVIKRWGVIVHHRPLGYRANAMIVIDVPDQQIDQLGQRISAYSFVNLCYQRPRQGSHWPYNLYCMIHGKDRDTVRAQWQALHQACDLSGFASEILFSRRCFKQRGALYSPRS